MRSYVDYKKYTFVFVGLCVIFISFAFAKPRIENAQIKSGKNFGDWVLSCANDDKNQKVCTLLSSVINTKDGKKTLIAQYKVEYLKQSKSLKMTQLLPLELLLQQGTAIICAKELIAHGKFMLCNANGCYAIVDLSKADLDKILAQDSNMVAVLTANGQQMNIPFSNKGLKDAIEYLMGM